MNRAYEFTDKDTGNNVTVRRNEFEGNLNELMRTNGLYSTIALIEEYNVYKSPSGHRYGEEITYSLARFSVTQSDRNYFCFVSLSDETKKYWFWAKTGGLRQVLNTVKIYQTNHFNELTAEDYEKNEKTNLIDVLTDWRICELIDCYDDSVPNICFSLLGNSNGKD